MKQLEQHIKDEIVITEEKQVIKQTKFLGSFHPKPGQRVWQLNLVTKKVDFAEFDSVVISINNSPRKKLLIKTDCIYTVAINKKNAEKKFIKMITKAL